MPTLVQRLQQSSSSYSFMVVCKVSRPDSVTTSRRFDLLWCDQNPGNKSPLIRKSCTIPLS